MTTANTTEPRLDSDTVNGLVGPSYCSLCGEWPARETKHGLRCHLCECRDICAEHPVPMPSNPQMRRDLESIGVIVVANDSDHRPPRGEVVR